MDGEREALDASYVDAGASYEDDDCVPPPSSLWPGFDDALDFEMTPSASSIALAEDCDPEGPLLDALSRLQEERKRNERLSASVEIARALGGLSHSGRPGEWATRVQASVRGFLVRVRVAQRRAQTRDAAARRLQAQARRLQRALTARAAMATRLQRAVRRYLWLSLPLQTKSELRRRLLRLRAEHDAALAKKEAALERLIEKQVEKHMAARRDRRSAPALDAPPKATAGGETAPSPVASPVAPPASSPIAPPSYGLLCAGTGSCGGGGDADDASDAAARQAMREELRSLRMETEALRAQLSHAHRQLAAAASPPPPSPAPLSPRPPSPHPPHRVPTPSGGSKPPASPPLPPAAPPPSAVPMPFAMERAGAHDAAASLAEAEELITRLVLEKSELAHELDDQRRRTNELAELASQHRIDKEAAEELASTLLARSMEAEDGNAASDTKRP